MKRLAILTISLALAALFPTGCARQDSTDQESSSQPSMHVRTLSESNFDAEIQNGVVLVDFWATWCGPCKMQAPIVDQLAERFADKIKVAKLDVDHAPKVAKRFEIRAIPTLVIFRNGKPEKQFVGLTKADTLSSAITTVLESK